MNGRGIGFVIGLMIGAVLVVILFRFANTNNKIKTEYDEMQEKIRGKAYRYSFYTAAVVQLLLAFASMCGIQLPVADYALHCLGLFTGFTVLGAYCVWNNVYWGLNNDHKKYGIIIIFGFLFNLAIVILAVMHGDLMEADGKIGLVFLNIMVVIMIAVMGIAHLARSLADRRSDSGEEN